MGHYYDCSICGQEKGAGGCACKRNTAKFDKPPKPTEPNASVEYILQQLQIKFMEFKRKGEDTIAEDFYHAWDSLDRVKERI